MDRKAKDARDDFWNIDQLVPKKRPASVFDDKHTEAVDVEIPLPDGSQGRKDPSARTEKIPDGGVIKRFVHPHTAESERIKTPDLEYSPQGSLIHKVRLYSWSSAYPYYEHFRKAALYYYNKTSQCVPHEPYFSYMPQYSQLTDRQLAFYLWFRGEIRAGRYPFADYSYVMLLVYETINLSDKLEPEKAVRLLSELWLNYRGEYPRLDVQLSEWIFDMCLIERLAPPSDTIGEIVASLPSTAGLREFYSDATGSRDAFASLLMRHCSNYNYKKSKFFVGENIPIYEKHVHGVLSHIISKCSDPSRPFELAGFRLQDSRTQRDSYTGALCIPKVKKRIEIEFCSFSHSHELRFIVTDVLKYAENRIRAHIGVKSRLSVNALPNGIKRLADEYFNRELPIKTLHPSIKDEIPDYEKLYEPERREMSFSSASEIESLSWETTGRLIEAFEEAEEEPTPDAPVPEADDNAADCAEDDLFALLSSDELDFLCAALEEGFSKQREIASRTGALPDILADRINTLSADVTGDVLLEESGGGYAVIEDYAEEVSKAIKERCGR